MQKTEIPKIVEASFLAEARHAIGHITQITGHVIIQTPDGPMCSDCIRLVTELQKRAFRFGMTHKKAKSA